MHHDAGVRTVAVGGRPPSGPMQAAAGTRGAASYDAATLDRDFAVASAISDKAAAALPARNESSFYYTYAGFNLRDQMRPDGTTPLQFLYEAANCRIYFTLANVYNYTRLWQDAASAIWNDTSLCVVGSTGYATSGNSTAALSPPAGTTDQSISHYVMNLDNGDINNIDFNILATGGIPDSPVSSIRSVSNYIDCTDHGQSQCRGQTCSPVTSICKDARNKPHQQTRYYCLPDCIVSPSAGCNCKPNHQAVTQQNRAATSLNKPHFNGHCQPSSGNTELLCLTSKPSKPKGAQNALPPF